MVALERRSPVVLALLLVHWNAQAAAGGAGPSSMPVLDPWKELGIERGADPSEVRQAYLRKARRVHPGKSRGRNKHCHGTAHTCTCQYTRYTTCFQHAARHKWRVCNTVAGGRKQENSFGGE